MLFLRISGFVLLLTWSCAGDVFSQLVADSSKSDPKKVEKPKPEPFEAVVVPPLPSDGRLVMSDSLFRWRPVHDLPEWMNRAPGWITARTYSFGRPSGAWHRGMTSERRAVFWEGIRVSDPFTGRGGLEFLPLPLLQTLHQDEAGSVFDMRLRRFDVARPLTDFSFEQTGFGYRRLTALHSQNIGMRTNIAGYVHAGDEGGVYPSAAVGLSQAAVLARHQVSEYAAFQVNLVRNRLNSFEPDGYVIPQMAAYSFNRFNTFPVETQARGSGGALWLQAGWLFNNPATNRAASVSLFRNAANRSFRGRQDSTSYQAIESGIHGSMKGNAGPVLLELSAAPSLLRVSQDSAPGVKTFGIFDQRVRAVYKPAPSVRLAGQQQGRFRSDGAADVDVDVSGTFTFSEKLNAGVLLQHRVQAPTLMETGFAAQKFSGNPDLKHSSIDRIGLTSAWVSGKWRMAFEGGLYSVCRPVFTAADSLLRNGPDYGGRFGTLTVERTARPVLLHLSATYMDRAGSSRQPEDLFLTLPDETLWLTSEIAFERYYFGKATFANVGFRSLFSPLAYRSASYVPRTGQWMMPLETEAIPGFFRADLFLNARIRQFFLYYQIENVLDGVGQFGYYETARYPMPPRRNRFGIRWIIRN